VIALLRQIDGGVEAGLEGGEGLLAALRLQEGDAEAVVDHGDVGVLRAKVPLHEREGLLLEADRGGHVAVEGELVAVEAEEAGEVDAVLGAGLGEQAAGVSEGGAGLGAQLGARVHALGVVGEGAADRAGAGATQRIGVAGGVDLGVAQPVAGRAGVAEAPADDVGEAGGGVDRNLGVGALDGEVKRGLEGRRGRRRSGPGSRGWCPRAGRARRAGAGRTRGRRPRAGRGR
jgi:hypothetical protein